MRVGPRRLLKAAVYALLGATLALGLSLHAQSTALSQSVVFDASRLHSPSLLNAKWLVHGGDDLAYAQPDFDDSTWTPFDPSTELTELFGKTRPQIVWYRLRVKVDPTQKDLALSAMNICRAFEVYVSGQRLISVGSVSPFRPFTYQARVRARIPEQLLASGSIVIALRVHLVPVEWNSGLYPGYYITNLTLGSEPALYSGDWLAIIADNWLQWIVYVLSLALGIVALVLFSAQRTQK